MSDKLTLTISNDLWSTEIGEHVTAGSLHMSKYYPWPRFEIHRQVLLDNDWPAPRSFDTVLKVDVETWVFERESFVIDGIRLELWKRVK